MLRMRKKRVSFKLHRSHRTPQRKPRLLVPIIALLFFVGLGTAVAGGIYYDKYHPSTETNSQSNAKIAAPVEQKQEDVTDIFSGYNKDLYDKDTNTYSFSSSDYNSLFKDTSLTDDGNGLRSGTYTRNGQTWNIYCYSSLNSCSVSTSSGTYGNVNCYNSTNSCSYSDSNGNYANTHCYEYTNSCSTTGSNGYSSNTYCYQYSNSCSTTDSSGGYSNTYCYQYSNSCTTNNSDGSTTNTYCYSYSNSCSSSTYGGSSSYDSYNSYNSYSNSYDY